MISNLDIERGVYHLFTGNDRRFAKVDLGQVLTEIKPGLNVAVASGNPVLFSMDEYRWDVSIVCIVAVKNTRSEIERRRLIHPLSQFVYRTLVNAQLVLVDDKFAPILDDDENPQFLDLGEITPGPWRETTTVDQFKGGESVFELQFKTSYNQSIAPLDESEIQDLDEILASFVVSDDTGPTVTGEGQTNLSQGAP